MRKKKLWFSMMGVLAICVMLCGTSMAALTYSVATLNETTSARSSAVGLDSQVRTWGYNGPGSTTNIKMWIYGGPAEEGHILQKTKTAAPKTNFDDTIQTGTSADWTWHIKLTSSLKAYGIGRIECVH